LRVGKSPAREKPPIGAFLRAYPKFYQPPPLRGIINACQSVGRGGPGAVHPKTCGKGQAGWGGGGAAGSGPWGAACLGLLVLRPVGAGKSPAREKPPIGAFPRAYPKFYQPPPSGE
jgi:hypothetical protein